MKVEIYSRADCPYCVNAKNAFKAADLGYTEYTVGANITKEQIQARVNKLGLNVQIKTVPQIFIDDVYIGGYTELVKQFEWAAAYHSNRPQR